MADRFGIETLALFTLTFADPVQVLQEAQRRFNSLNTNVLKARYERAIATVERQRSRRVHFHLVVPVGADIRSGVDFEAFARRDYRTAGPALRAEWAFWRKTCPKYRFGRHELLPIKSSAEAIGKYVGKYVGKHIGNREAGDMGARLVRYLGFKKGERSVGSNFAWNSDGGWIWRHKLATWAKEKGLADTEAIKAIYGPRWAYLLRNEILAVSLGNVIYPSLEAGERALDLERPLQNAYEKARDVLHSPAFIKTYILGKRTYEK